MFQQRLYKSNLVLALLLGLLAFYPFQSYAQHKKAVDAPVYFKANNLIFDQYENPDAQRLSGKVWFSHAGMTLTCDSAVYYQSAKSFEAFGHVKMKQGDTLTITGDRLLYDGPSQTSYVVAYNSEVAVHHRLQQLYSDSLFYDARNKFITYENGGKLIDGKNVLTSNYGEYYTDTRQAVFRYNVEFIDDKDRLVTDELHYNRLTKEAQVVGKSNIFSGDYNIYTTSGNYFSNNEVVNLHERSILNNPKRKVHVEADKVHYDKKNGHLKATGKVLYLDLQTRVIMTGEECVFDENKVAASDSAYMTGKALVKDFSQGKDTLYVHADTLRLYSYNVKTDSLYRIMKGYKHARAYRKDVQAVADSLIYYTQTRELSLYQDPVLWTDNRQLLGESIHVFSNDSTVDSVHVREQALLAEQLDNDRYNQVSGKLMRAYFNNGEMTIGAVDGNVRIINYVMERDSVILYQNFLEAPSARMYVEKRRIQRAVAFPTPKGVLYPLGLAPKEHTRFPNFNWFDYIRPKDEYDLFEWRSKHSGSELKVIQRRQAPLQTL